MRKLLTCLLLFSISTSGFSQLTEGTWLVGGSGQFTKFASIRGKTSYLELSPNVGFFLLDKFVVGLKPSYVNEKSTSTGSSFLAKSSGFYIGPFARYYLLKADNQFNLLLEGNYQYGIEKTGDRFTTTNNRRSNFSFAAGPVIYFNSSVGLELLAGYGQSKYISDYLSQDRVFVSIGFQVHLDK